MVIAINLSFSSGIMASNLINKEACLGLVIFNHFKPIANLTYLSKLFENVVASRLFDQIKTSALHECLQSSYKKYQSTEAAPNCIHDDIFGTVNEKQCVILLWFALGAAFDTATCYCQGCNNTLLYVVLHSNGFSHVCPNQNSLYWLIV